MPIRKNKHLYSRIRIYRTLALSIAALFVLELPVAWAQAAGEVTRIDRYGNAQPTYRERRSVDVFRNKVQEQMLRSYQDEARRTNRRGGLNPFTLPGELRRRRSDFLVRSLFTPSDNQRSAAIQRMLARDRGYQKYGGFGRRKTGAVPGDLGTALNRRRELVEATSFNAPINRTGYGAAGGLTFLPPKVRPSVNPQELPEMSESTPTLRERLSERARADRQMARANAWTDFQRADYRRAARMFETVAQLDPDNAEAYLGEMFCHLALGAPKTAFYLFRSFVKRAPDPFAINIDLTKRFRKPEETLRIRMESRALFEGAVSHPDLRAMQTIILWYLGSRNEARAALNAMMKEFPNSRYSAWIHQLPSKVESREGPSPAAP